MSRQLSITTVLSAQDGGVFELRLVVLTVELNSSASISSQRVDVGIRQRYQELTEQSHVVAVAHDNLCVNVQYF